MGRYAMLVLVCLATNLRLCGQDIRLAQNGKSTYKIVVPQAADRNTRFAADVLRGYFSRATDIALEVVTEGNAGNGPFISIGETDLAGKASVTAGLRNNGYAIVVQNANVIIAGKGTKGTLYGVYTFLEKYLGCRKWWAGAPVVPHLGELSIASGTRVIENPAFEYREVFYPPSNDQEYLDWHKLQRHSEAWGLWGHSFNKLVPPAVHFSKHPEYFALVNGVRSKTQLCLSNAKVVEIATDTLAAMMARNPDALYWSVAANDGGGFCECSQCSALSKREGGPQGPLISFVNKIAAQFPKKTITTLAYSATAHAPKTLRPAGNVIVLFSNIAANRTLPLQKEPTAVGVLADLKAWKAKTSNLFVWDYVTQFSNYLVPFPVVQNQKPNMMFLKNQLIEGVFVQGSGNIYSDMAELKAYVIAKLLWDPGINAEQLTDEFIKGYYGASAPFVKEYVDLLYNSSLQKKAKLTLQGTPAESSDTYLSRALMAKYDNVLDRAEKAAAGNNATVQRVSNIRLSYDYAYLQLARFYGLDDDGIFVKDAKDTYVAKEALKEKVNQFEDKAVKAGALQISEGGMSPQVFKKEWQNVMAGGVRKTVAVNAKASLATVPMAAYKSKGARTLVDGMQGYLDFANYLCFRGTSMIATIDLGNIKAIKSISATFLENPVRMAFRPQSVKVEISADGKRYEMLDEIKSATLKETANALRIPFNFDITSNKKVRFIRITAKPFPKSPAWSNYPNSQPVLACDEVWIQ